MYYEVLEGVIYLQTRAGESSAQRKITPIHNTRITWYRTVDSYHLKLKEGVYFNSYHRPILCGK
jgi:hypothetical protein